MPKNKDFQVGDVVRIRDYEEMKSEFGLIDNNGTINCNSRFLTQMKYLCGHIFNISFVNDNGTVGGCDTTWTISTDMLELVQDDEVVQSEELSNYLSEISIVGE